MNQKKLDELERLRYFGCVVKNNLSKVEDKDIESYFNYSSNGIKPEIETEGYKGLIEAKRQQGITIHELYELGILDGTVPYFTLLGGEDIKEIPPRGVVDFMKKEMFKGKDSDLIESIYQDILKND